MKIRTKGLDVLMKNDKEFISISKFTGLVFQDSYKFKKVRKDLESTLKANIHHIEELALKNGQTLIKLLDGGRIIGYKLFRKGDEVYLMQNLERGAKRVRSHRNSYDKKINEVKSRKLLPEKDLMSIE